MKKIEDNSYQSMGFRPLTLFLDDIEKILEILKKSYDNIEIITGGYEFTDVNDLKNLNCQKIKELKIQARNSKNYESLSVTLEKGSARIYASTRSMNSDYSYTHISEILKRAERKWLYLFRYGVLNYLAWLTFIWFEISHLFKPNNLIYINIRNYSFLIFLISTFFLFFFNEILHTLIYLNFRREKISFWDRYKEIIIPILTLIAGYLLNYFSTKK